MYRGSSFYYIRCDKFSMVIGGIDTETFYTIHITFWDMYNYTTWCRRFS